MTTPRTERIEAMRTVMSATLAQHLATAISARITMRQLADILGVPKSNLHYHFAATDTQTSVDVACTAAWQWACVHEPALAREIELNEERDVLSFIHAARRRGGAT